MDLAVFKRALVKDFALQPGGFTVDGANYLPNDAVTLSARLRNVGDVAVGNVTVAFYDGDPGTYWSRNCETWSSSGVYTSKMGR